jgi:hypothetical protein
MQDWLSTTRDIQTTVYGRDPATLTGPDHAEFIRWNILAAVAELMEALEETRWKTWAVLADGEAVVPDAEALASELVDAQMFIANVLVSAGVVDADYERVYRAKWDKNIERQQREEGYQSRAGVDKCPRCRRSFDDVGRGGAPVDGQDLCAKCVDGVLADGG